MHTEQLTRPYFAATRACRRPKALCVGGQYAGGMPDTPVVRAAAGARVARAAAAALALECGRCLRAPGALCGRVEAGARPRSALKGRPADWLAAGSGSAARVCVCVCLVQQPVRLAWHVEVARWQRVAGGRQRRAAVGSRFSALRKRLTPRSSQGFTMSVAFAACEHSALCVQRNRVLLSLPQRRTRVCVCVAAQESPRGQTQQQTREDAQGKKTKKQMLIKVRATTPTTWHTRAQRGVLVDNARQRSVCACQWTMNLMHFSRIRPIFIHSWCLPHLVSPTSSARGRRCLAPSTTGINFQSPNSTPHHALLPISWWVLGCRSGRRTSPRRICCLAPTSSPPAAGCEYRSWPPRAPN